MIVLDFPTLSEAIGVKNGVCPTCEGSGLERYNVARDPFTGTWDYDERTCPWCEGTGLIELTRCQGLECTDWFDREVNGCQHGQPLCDDHRPECPECMADAREDADPWGGAA